MDSDETHHFQTFEIEHYGLKQRWVVVRSAESLLRAQKTVETLCLKEHEKLSKTLRKLSLQAFSSKQDALEAVGRCFEGVRLHALHDLKFTESKTYSSKGRPGKASSCHSHYHVEATFCQKEENKQKEIIFHSCFVIGTTVSDEELNDKEVVLAYKNQNATVERGFRFLKDPILFASSFFVKKPERIMGLLLVMTLALLVYSIAQRRLRHRLKQKGETLPDQINRPTAHPTLRWIFQVLEGIEIVRIKIEGHIHEVFTDLNALKKRILAYFGMTIAKIYNLEKDTAQAY